MSSSEDDIFDMIAEQEDYLQEHRNSVDNLNIDMFTTICDDINSPDVSKHPVDTDVNVQTSDSTSWDGAIVDVNVLDGYLLDHFNSFSQT
ncbi:hypothetical protein DPMN_157409 [Dreissena polymorpha]|uniref:Uncharacterized protein n=1 Tax=Dreissena polymorpha TaxID=45954 RepID=A0A9D4EJB9_DREPO|nr:hypothetical protein DPMN_157408 [Dreissena polymorpha]KAH3779606.1 hypothetical protein DPMN_157409 [Dreissena polymorpha]